VIERILPSAVVTYETGQELIETELFPEEERSLGQAVEKRRREFVTARACARRALERLGVEPGPVPNGERGEPVWPEGVVGSITHCAVLRACAVARASDLASVGIDAEVHERLPEGVFETIASPAERRRLAGQGGGPFMDRVMFSAKEAVYKAWFPLARRWLGFEDVDMTVETDASGGGGTFRARLLVEGPVVGERRLTELGGRWLVDGDVVATAVVVEL
jgi:4'-phosphopantetheinyl transferase EntD